MQRVTPIGNKISFVVDLANAVLSKQTDHQFAVNAALLINVPDFSIQLVILDGPNQISDQIVKIIFVFSSEEL